MDNFEIEKTTVPSAGEPAPAPMPTPMPTPAPEPAGPAPVIPPIQQQPAATPSPVSAEPMAPTARPEERPVQTNVRMEAPIEPVMRPIDLSAHEGAAPQANAPMDEGKKKMVIIAIVVVAGLIAGAAGFFIWRAMGPAEEVIVPEQALPVSDVSIVTPVVIPVIEADDISVIEKELGSFNVADIDKESQGSLDAINAEL